MNNRPETRNSLINIVQDYFDKIFYLLVKPTELLSYLISSFLYESL